MVAHASSLADALAARLAEAASAFLASDPGPNGSGDAERVHDSRVALRRACSYLRTFNALVDWGVAPSMRPDLKWYVSYLSEARDIDAVGHLVGGLGATLDGEIELAPLLACVEDARSEALERLREATTLARYGRVLDHVEALVALEVAPCRPTEARRLLARASLEFRQATRRLERADTPARLHELRIRSMDLGYAGEVVAGIEPELATKLAVAAAAVEERIAAHRDALWTSAFLKGRADELGQSAFGAGMVALLARQQASERLAGLKEDLRLVRRRCRRLLRALP